LIKYFQFPISNIALSVFGISGDFSHCKDIEISKCRKIFYVVVFYLLECLKNYYLTNNETNVDNLNFEQLKLYFEKIGNDLKEEVFKNNGSSTFQIENELMEYLKDLNKKSKDELKNICKTKNLKFGVTKTDAIFSLVCINDNYKQQLLLKKNYSKESLSDVPLFIFKLILKINNKPKNCTVK
jgi:hypothetical protein